MFVAALRRDFAAQRAQGKLLAFVLGAMFVSLWPWAGLLAWGIALLAPALACMAAARDRAAGTDEQLRVAGIGPVEAAASALFARMAWVVAIAIAFFPMSAVYFDHAAPHLFAVALAVGCLGTGAGLAVGRRLPGIIGMLGAYVALAALVYVPATLLGIPNVFEEGATWQSILLAIDLGLIVAIAGFARRDAHSRETVRTSGTVDRDAIAWGEARRWRSPAAATAIVGSVAVAEWLGRFLSDNQLPHAWILVTLFAPVILATLAGASAVTSERERGTLSLLRLALDDGEIVRGKLAGFLRGTWMLFPVPAATALALGEGPAAAGLVALLTFALVTTSLASGIACSRGCRTVAGATAFAFVINAAATLLLVVLALLGLAQSAPQDLPAASVVIALSGAAALAALFASTRSAKRPEVELDGDVVFDATPAYAGHAPSRTTPDVARDVRRIHERIDDAPAGRLTVAEVGAEGAVSVADDPRGRVSAARKPNRT